MFTLLSLGTLAITTAAAVEGPFITVGSKLFDSTGKWVVFRGIGVTCTEYCARPNMPLEEESWPGQFAYQACFGGAASANVSQLTLNDEPANMLKYLLPDSLGGAFVTAPRVTKASWPAPYDQVLSAGAPARVIPTVRIPVTSGSYLYDEEANGLKSAGYRAVIDLLVQNFTSQGIAVIIDQHGCCADGGKLNCSSRGGPMALRDFGEKTGAAVAFWDLVAATYANNSLVLYETYNEPHVWYQVRGAPRCALCSPVPCLLLHALHRGFG